MRLTGHDEDDGTSSDASGPVPSNLGTENNPISTAELGLEANTGAPDKDYHKQDCSRTAKGTSSPGKWKSVRHETN